MSETVVAHYRHNNNYYCIHSNFQFAKVFGAKNSGKNM